MDYRSAKTFRLVSSRLLAAALAVLLLILGLLSASDALHQFFHHGDRQGASPCAVCLLVKGHLESPTPAPVMVGPVVPVIGAVPLEGGTAPSFTYQSAPSRAPPALICLSPVVV